MGWRRTSPGTSAVWGNRGFSLGLYLVHASGTRTRWCPCLRAADALRRGRGGWRPGNRPGRRGRATPSSRGGLTTGVQRPANSVGQARDSGIQVRRSCARRPTRAPANKLAETPWLPAHPRRLRVLRGHQAEGQQIGGVLAGVGWEGWVGWGVAARRRGIAKGKEGDCVISEVWVPRVTGIFLR